MRDFERFLTSFLMFTPCTAQSLTSWRIKSNAGGISYITVKQGILQYAHPWKHIMLRLFTLFLAPQICCSESNLRSRLSASLSCAHLCFFLQGGRPKDCTHIPEQESRVFGLYHLHRPLRSEHEFTGRQLPNVTCFCCRCSTVWGQTYERLY